MAGRYENVNGVWQPVKKRYDKVGGVWQPVKKRWGKVGGVWQTSYIRGVTADGTFSWDVTAGLYRDEYHFSPQVIFDNGLHINIPWTYDGGVSGGPAEAYFTLTIPVSFNQTIDFVKYQPIWGLSEQLSYSGNYIGSDALPDLYLDSTYTANLIDAQRIGSSSMYTFDAKEVNAMRNISLTKSGLSLSFWLTGGGKSAHGSTFAMDIPNEALYILSQGARIPFIFG